jgi:hypothetical protein
MKVILILQLSVNVKAALGKYGNFQHPVFAIWPLTCPLLWNQSHVQDKLNAESLHHLDLHFKITSNIEVFSFLSSYTTCIIMM